MPVSIRHAIAGHGDEREPMNARGGAEAAGDGREKIPSLSRKDHRRDDQEQEQTLGVGNRKVERAGGGDREEQHATRVLDVACER